MRKLKIYFGISLLFIGIFPSSAQNVPARPQQPYGLSGLCKGQKQVAYSISSITNASSYIWSLLPDSAGSVIGTDTSIFIDFSATFFGTAKLSVIASNSFGQSQASDTLQITIHNDPEQPPKPTGDSIACKGGQILSFYIPSQKQAGSYIWQITPSGAASLTQNDTSVIMNIFSNFQGNIKLSVSAKNSCFQSANSVAKTIQVIQTPFTPSTPHGNELYCATDSIVEFYTLGSTYATSYNWKITPDTIAQLVSSGTLLDIHFNPDFRDSFSVQVQAINQCGNSDFSAIKNSYLKIIPQKPGNIKGDTLVCQGTDLSQYTIDTTEETDYYTWYFTPDYAGEITGIIPEGNVYWNKEFTGNAYIYASASNVCGESEHSDTLKVHVLSKPGKATIPDGIKEMCLNAPEMYYTTQTITNASSYLWIISPFNAGTITGDSLVAKVDWLDSYVGNVKIAVKGVNQCGYGKTSDSLHISLKNELHSVFSYKINTNKVDFSNESFPELELNHFLWNFGDSTNIEAFSPSHSYQSSGNYTVTLIIQNPYCLSDTSKQELSIDLNSNSVRKLDDTKIKIYPVPSKNYLNIQFEKEERIEGIYLTDLQGKILLKKKMINSSGLIKINISDLKAGSYFLLIKKLTYFYSTKIIKY